MLAMAIVLPPSRCGVAQVTTLIGYGSPNKAGTHDVHGAALGEPETEETRSNLGWKYPPFELPDGVKETMSRVEEVSRLIAQLIHQDWCSTQSILHPASIPRLCCRRCVHLLRLAVRLGERCWLQHGAGACTRERFAALAEH